MHFRIVFVGVLMNVFLFGQNSKGPIAIVAPQSSDVIKGNTYAVVIGISDYLDPRISQLHFADDDAIAFYDLLLSGAVGKTDSSHVKLLLNENARGGDIWAALDWVSASAKQNDRVFIYFSGHGNSIDARQSYLLAADAPGGDANHYRSEAGVIQIYNLKCLIHDLQNKNKAQVIFITDACRSNESSDNSENVYQNIMNDNLGEIQFNSCSSNESSLEDTRWGGGRGVFSWFLCNGLYGLADANNDNVVSFKELDMYVSSNVYSSTLGLTAAGAQTPESKLGSNSVHPFAFVNTKKKTETIASLTKTHSKNELSFGKGFVHFASVEAQADYEKIETFINAENYNTPGNECAYSVLCRSLQNSEINQKDKKSLTLIYTAAARNFGQRLISNYLAGGIFHLSNADFRNGANAFKSLIELKNYDEESLKGNYFFFLARSMTDSYDANLSKYGLSLCDSALKYIPSAAYLYNAQGMLYNNLGMDSLSMNSYRIALNLAPTWSFPLNNWGQIYFQAQNYNRAVSYFESAIRIDSSNAIAWSNLGLSYFNLYNNLGGGYDFLALNCLHHSYEIDSTLSPTIRAIGDYYYSDRKDSIALLYYEKALRMQPDEWENYLALADFYEIKNPMKAIGFYEKALEYKGDSSDIYNSMGVIWDRLLDSTKAKNYFEKSCKKNPENKFAIGNLLDYNYFDVQQKILFLDSLIKNDSLKDYLWTKKGNILLAEKQKDKAIYCYEKAYGIHPNQDNLFDLMEGYYFNFEDSLFRKYLNLATGLYPENSIVIYYNGMNFVIQHKTDSALIYLNNHYKGFGREDRCYSLLGDLYYDKKEYKSAARFYGEACQVGFDPSDEFVWGLSLYKDKDYKAAAKVFENFAIKDSSANLEGIMFAAISFLLCNEPMDANVFLNKADSLLHNEDFLKDYPKKLVSKNVEVVSKYQNISNQMTGDSEKGMKKLKKALKKGPEWILYFN
ncbi:hypothetical protein BH09BAC5_BH09BAC5_08170 [soil metagenome]